MSFANLKRSSGSASLEKLTKEVEKMSGNGNNNDNRDERFWKPTQDKAGNGSAVIRWLPAAEGEDVPFIRKFKHAFKGPGGWYIENSLTTIGKDDPVSDFNSSLWEGTTDDEDPKRKQVRNQKRKLSYIANIYVVKDPGNTDNEGKVFLYEFGKKIFDKVNDKMNPPEEDIDAVNPFDLWQGANFRLRVRKVEDWPNYDKSEFDLPSALLDGDDDALETVYNQIHPLQPIIAPDQFKAYDALQARLQKVLGDDKAKARANEPKSEDEVRQEPKSSPPKEFKSKEAAEPASSDDGDDEILAEFRRLAAEEE